MDDQSLEIIVGNLLRSRGLHMAAAESCTGGLIGHRITNVAGSSDYYLGSVTAYANQAKMSLLGVQLETLEKYGAVSKETVLEMARGIRQTLKAEIGISVSGIAGPGGGTPEKPVGTVWIGLSAASGTGRPYEVNKAWCYLWQGSRLQIKEQSAQQALQLLVDFLRDGTD